MNRIVVEPIMAGIIGPSEIIVLVIALLLLFGGKKIPELMKGLGQGIKEFKDASSGEKQNPVSKPESTEKEIENK